MGNDEVMVNVPLSAFMQLSDMVGRTAAFVDYVNAQEFSIPRETCAAILGFELKAVDSNV